VKAGGDGDRDEKSAGGAGSPVDAAATSGDAEHADQPKVRIPAPLLLLRAHMREHWISVAAAAGVCSVLLVVLALAIVEVTWGYPGAGILVGLGLAIVGAATPSSWPTNPRLGPSGWPKALLLLSAAVAPLVGVVVAVSVLMRGWYIVAMVLVTIALIWVTLGALANASRAAVALTLFVALALWAGALGFLRDLGADDPKLETAVVERKDAPTVSGFYLGGSGTDVYIASESEPRTVTLIKKDDVVRLSFGEAAPGRSGGSRQRQSRYEYGR
jgi:hypothetical protein